MIVRLVILALVVVILDATVHTQTKALMEDLKEARLVISKSKRTLEVFDGDTKIKSYKMVLGFDPKGGKEIEGDGRTPEGDFYVFTKNPESRFHLSLGVSYPGKEDVERGLNAGLISQTEHDEIIAAIVEQRIPLQKTKLGGEIYIHGGGTASDWTDGCVALDNDQMTELFNAIPIGAKVTILP
ncbi:MAG: L,D-transpeptidase family protein [bacterium]|nr:L,D-transpeptidase family protein [bacterium]